MFKQAQIGSDGQPVPLRIVQNTDKVPAREIDERAILWVIRSGGAMDNRPHMLLREITVSAIAIDDRSLIGTQPTLPAKQRIFLAASSVQPDVLTRVSRAGWHDERLNVTAFM